MKKYRIVLIGLTYSALGAQLAAGRSEQSTKAFSGLEEAKIGGVLRRRVVEAPLSTQNTTFKIYLPRDFVPSPDIRLRIKNFTTGQEALFPIKLDSEGAIVLQSQQFEEITDHHHALLRPQMSLLVYKKSIYRRIDPQLSAKNLDTSVGKSLFYDQPVWKNYGFKSDRSTAQLVKLRLSDEFDTQLVDKEEAEHFDEQVKKESVHKLFIIGWGSIKISRFDLALEAFNNILERTKEISESKLAKSKISEAHLGKAISLYNQEGCKKIEPDLAQADRSVVLRDDVSYYRALCLKENKKPVEASALFQGLVTKQHPKYGEVSRYQMGVIADEADQFEDAESIYMDLVDFSQNKDLVEIVKVRLKNLQIRKEDYYYQHKWLGLVASLGLGYDSNVVNVPAVSDLGALGVSSQSSLNMLNLGVVEIQPPWKAKVFNQKFSVMALNLHYFDTLISTKFDVQVYDASSRFEWTLSPLQQIQFGFGYSSIYLGYISTSTEFQASPYADLKWKRIRGKVEDPQSEQEWGVKYSRVYPKVASISDLDGHANSYALNWKYTIKNKKPYSFGPGLAAEYHPAVGKENSYYSAEASGRFEMPIPPVKWKLNLSQDLTGLYSYYYQSAALRREYNWKYSASVGRLFWNRLDTRFQLAALLNQSNVDSKKYQKYTLNLLLSAVY